MVAERGNGSPVGVLSLISVVASVFLRHIQHLTHLARQLLRVKRLVQEVYPRLQDAVMHDGVVNGLT